MTDVRAVFGVVSLLVALVIVGLVLVKQLKAVGPLGAAPTATGSQASSAPAIPGRGNVRESAVQLERKVADDVAKAMEQAASARDAEIEKP